jgi:hypothetical protein
MGRRVRLGRRRAALLRAQADADLWTRLNFEAEKFFAQVEERIEPAPFGAPVEIPLLVKLFPTVTGNPLDLSGDTAAEPIAQKIADYKYAKGQEAAFGKAADLLRAEILALARDHDEITLPFGVKVNVSTTSNKQKRIKVFVPDSAPIRPTDDVGLLAAG